MTFIKNLIKASCSTIVQLENNQSLAYDKVKGAKMRLYFLLLPLIISIDLGAKTMSKEIATLAGGCFWGMEDILRSVPGVINTTVGYTGGVIENPTYNIVKLGTSHHAEAVEVEFNPGKISFSELLNYFFRMHDPTTLNRQMNDVGTQYRSAIFYHSERQRELAVEKIKEIEKSKKWKNPIVTQVIPVAKFYPAEEYHQDYLKKNPNGYTCHWLRD